MLEVLNAVGFVGLDFCHYSDRKPRRQNARDERKMGAHSWERVRWGKQGCTFYGRRPIGWATYLKSC